jgi:endoglucanase
MDMKKYVMKKIIFLLLLFIHISCASAKLTLQEIHTASNKVLVAVFVSEKVVATNYNQWIKEVVDVNEVETEDISTWKLNGQLPLAIHKFVTESSATSDLPKMCEHRIYLEIPQLINGTQYKLETPHGDKTFVFNDRTMLCESIKTNQNGYSALSSVRYANFSIWMGTGGSQQISGALPAYDVFDISTGHLVSRGKLQEIGPDESSGDFVYCIDLSEVPEGGPYNISVNGYGCSWPFGVGGDFSRRLAYISFRSLYHQRCGCPVREPYAQDIRMNPCHTVLYNVNAPPGEAKLEVRGTEPSFKCYGGYHDAGDADRRLYHLVVAPILLTTYEAFPDYFTDNQFNIPDKFDDNFNIVGKGNGIPDIIDEAQWATLIWEYLQEPSGGVHWGTETRGYPEPFAAPMDQDTKKYGTLRIDKLSTSMAAGMFMHLARIIKPYKPERCEELRQRAEKAMAYADNTANNPQRFYFAVQKYLLTGDETAHRQIKDLVNVVDDYIKSAPDNPGHFGGPHYVMASYFYSYIIETHRPTDAAIVQHMKDVLRKTADRQIDIFKSFAYPIGNSLSTRRWGWGCNVAQGQYAYPCLLQWALTKEKRYIDTASQLMDYNQGLNPIGKCYVTGIGFDRVKNPHDRESAYTKAKGWGPKPGIQVYGPGNLPSRIQFSMIPKIATLPRERQWADHLYTISMTEFTVHETLVYPAVVYPVLAQGGTWNDTKDPFVVKRQ